MKTKILLYGSIIAIITAILILVYNFIIKGNKSLPKQPVTPPPVVVTTKEVVESPPPVVVTTKEVVESPPPVVEDEVESSPPPPLDGNEGVIEPEEEEEIEPSPPPPLDATEGVVEEEDVDESTQDLDAIMADMEREEEEKIRKEEQIQANKLDDDFYTQFEEVPFTSGWEEEQEEYPELYGVPVSSDNKCSDKEVPVKIRTKSLCDCRLGIWNADIKHNEEFCKEENCVNGADEKYDMSMSAGERLSRTPFFDKIDDNIPKNYKYKKVLNNGLSIQSINKINPQQLKFQIVYLNGKPYMMRGYDGSRLKTKGAQDIYACVQNDGSVSENDITDFSEINTN